jgi:hypothetical protein
MQRQFQRIADPGLEACRHFHARKTIRVKESAAVRGGAKVPQVCGEPVRNIYHGSGQALLGEPSSQR